MERQALSPVEKTIEIVDTAKRNFLDRSIPLIDQQAQLQETFKSIVDLANIFYPEQVGETTFSFFSEKLAEKDVMSPETSENVKARAKLRKERGISDRNTLTFIKKINEETQSPEMVFKLHYFDYLRDERGNFHDIEKEEELTLFQGSNNKIFFSLLERTIADSKEVDGEVFDRRMEKPEELHKFDATARDINIFLACLIIPVDGAVKKFKEPASDE